MLVWPFFAALGTGEKTILPPPRHATRIAVPRALFVPHKLNSRPLRVRGPIQPRKFDLMRALNKIHMLKLYYIAISLTIWGQNLLNVMQLPTTLSRVGSKPCISLFRTCSVPSLPTSTRKEKRRLRAVHALALTLEVFFARNVHT